MISFVKDFLKLEAASAIVLMFSALLALIAANSSLAPYYETLQQPNVEHFINDGLMAIFFLLIGIEIKSEMKDGQLATMKQAMLPLAAAVGGVVAPALIFCYYNWGSPWIHGWAIPSATDIAFSLGVLALFGRRIPTSLRVFLMAVAVMDDLLAVVIIAMFYTQNISYPSLAVAVSCGIILYLYRRRVRRMLPYLLAGAGMWVATLDSGVHATIAGVALGFIMPLVHGRKLLNVLHPWVAYGIIPLFAFVNAGIPLTGLTEETLSHALTFGVMLGLFVGKQVGIFAAAALLIALGYGKLPESASWPQFYAVCMIAGIGFTMSLFIGSLAFGHDEAMTYTRIGVMIGSLASAVVGSIVLFVSTSSKKGYA